MTVDVATSVAQQSLRTANEFAEIALVAQTERRLDARPDGADLS